MKREFTHVDVPFLVLDLGFDVVDGVRRLHLKGDRLPREGLDENLHFCCCCRWWRAQSITILTTM